MTDNLAATSGPGPVRRVLLIIMMTAAIFAFGIAIGKRIGDQDEGPAAAAAVRP